MLYKRIDNPKEGQLVQFLGVYATRWPRESSVEPTVAFIEIEEVEAGDNRPICPDCSAVMVKAHEQNEEGDWGIRWLCECKPDLQIITSLEKVEETWVSAGKGYIDWPEPD